MNEVLCYSDNEYKKTEGALNTAIGNLMADAVFEQLLHQFLKNVTIWT